MEEEEWSGMERKKSEGATGYIHVSIMYLNLGLTVKGGN